MSVPMSTHTRPGPVTRAKNANQRPGKILINARRTRRSAAQVAADKKTAEEAAAAIAVKNGDITARNATVVGHTVQTEQGSTTTPPEIIKCTRGSSGLACADAESIESTTTGLPIYDIVSLAQMIVAELERPKRKTSRDRIGETEVQQYALRPYYPYRNSQPHLMY